MIFKIPNKNTEKVRSLGEGSYGSVHLVRFKEKDGTFKHYAMKSSEPWARSNLAKELRLLSKFHGCPGVIQCRSKSLMETYNSNGGKMFSMFLEYAEGGTLENLMEKHQDNILPDNKIRQCVKMILNGLESIHEMGYVHCDLKPENILVFNRTMEKDDGAMGLIEEVKIADFGLAMEPREKRKDWWSPSLPFRGTPLYMSPESVKSGRIGSFLDIWSVGCIALEMYTGKYPWPYETVQEIAVALSNGMTPEIPEHLPLVAKHFLKMCFVLNPKYRFTASQLLRHPLLQENSDELERYVAVKNEVVKKDKNRKVKQQSPVNNKVLRIKIKPPKPKILKLKIKLQKPVA